MTGDVSYRQPADRVENDSRICLNLRLIQYNMWWKYKLEHIHIVSLYTLQCGLQSIIALCPYVMQSNVVMLCVIYHVIIAMRLYLPCCSMYRIFHVGMARCMEYNTYMVHPVNNVPPNYCNVSIFQCVHEVICKYCNRYLSTWHITYRMQSVIIAIFE